MYGLLRTIQYVIPAHQCYTVYRIHIRQNLTYLMVKYFCSDGRGFFQQRTRACWMIWSLECDSSANVPSYDELANHVMKACGRI